MKLLANAIQGCFSRPGRFCAGIAALVLLFLNAIGWAQKGPARLLITPKNVLLQPTQLQPLQAAHAYLGGASQNGALSPAAGLVSWTSSQTAVASVDSSGVVKAVAAGSAVVTARSGPFSGSTGVIVTSSALSAICISPASASAAAGLTQQYTATGLFGSGSCPGSIDITGSVAWSSSDATIATVSNGDGREGLARGVSAGGPVNITAAYGSVSASATLRVTPAILQTITVTPNPADIPNPGGTLTFTATGSYSDGIPRVIPNSLTASVNWTSSSPSIATISSAGVATAAAQNRTVITTTDPSTSISGVATLTVGPLNATTYYVSTKGSDSGFSGMLPAVNAGSTDGPFASPARAQQAVESTAPGNPIFVMLRVGTYYLQLSSTKPGTMVLQGAPDSGTSSSSLVTWQSYPGETAAISGGVLIGTGGLGLSWNNLGGNLWQVTLPANVQAGVPLQNFESLFYNGQRRLRPRLGGLLGTYLRFAGPVFLPNAPPPAPPPTPNCSVYVSGSGWECYDRFQYNSGDPITSAWQNLAPPANNLCGLAAGNANLVGDIEVLDFEKFTAPKLRISCVDTTSHIVYLTGPTAIPPATQATDHGFIPNHRYLVENVANALAQPGQFFLDRSTTPWVLNYLANAGENPGSDAVVIPQLTQVFVASGVQYVTVAGLTFEHDNFVVPAAGHVSMQQEANISTAVSCQNCQNVTFDSDTVTQTTGGGLEIISCVNSAQSPANCVVDNTNAVSASNAVQNGAFYDLGAMGMRVGVDNRPADTDANVPQFTTLQNNVVEGYGRIFPAAFGISQGDGHDNLYTHNDVYDGYHAAISICSPPCPLGQKNSQGAFNNVISFNHVYNLLQGIMDDGGSLYFATGNSSFAASGNKMLNNKVHDVNDASALDADGYGGNGLYLDNQTGMVEVENNLVYRVSGATMFITQSPPAVNEAHTIKNNIFAYGRPGMVENGNPYPTNIAPPNPILVFNASNNLFYFDRTASSAPPFYAQRGCTYSAGFAYSQYQNWSSNLYWRTDGAFGSDPKAFHVQPAKGSASLCAGLTSWTFYNFAGWQTTVGEDAQSVVQNPGFANPAFPNDDYSLPAGSPGVGFVVFDPSQAGRSNPVINPPAIPATFPTAVFDPATQF